MHIYISDQLLSCVQLFTSPWTAAYQASLSITNSQSLLKLMSIKSVMPSNHLILCCPLLLLPSIFPSIRVISNKSVLHIRWPKYWSFSFSDSPSNEYSGLISFSINRLDLLAGQGTLKSLLQYLSVQKHQFFSAQLYYIIYILYILYGMWKCWSLSHVRLFVTPWTVDPMWPHGPHVTPRAF